MSAAHDKPSDPKDRDETFGPTPMMLRSVDAFRRDLPELLKTHYWQWVAYHGDERIGIGRTETELYQECLRRGLTDGDFFVGSIEPAELEPDDEIEASGSFLDVYLGTLYEPADRPATLSDSGKGDLMSTAQDKQSDPERRGTNFGPSPMMLRSIEAFRRDLPELLKTHYWQWVAYHGKERIGIGRTQTQLYQECLRRGLPRGEFFVGSIDPTELQCDQEFEASLDV